MAAEADARYDEAAWRALDAFYAAEPYYLTRHHIDSFDAFLDDGAARVIRSMNPLSIVKEEGGHNVRIEVWLGQRGVQLDRPTVVGPDGHARALFPNEARLKDLVYSTRLHTDMEVRYIVDGEPMGEPVVMPDPVCVGAVPLMLHSRHCLLHGLPAQVLRELGECPHDQGGYFVVDGKEKVIVSRETFVLNRLYIQDHASQASASDYRVTAYMRCGKPDDAFPRTIKVRVRSPSAFSRPGAVSVEIDHLGRKDVGGRRAHMQVPLFVMFRLLGVESDRAIMQHVVGDVDAPEEVDMLEMLRASALEAASQNIMSQRAAIEALASSTTYGTVDNVKRVVVQNLFTNVGDSLPRKALLLGAVVRRALRVVLNKDEVPDQDDYINKRIELSGTLLRELFRNLYFRVTDRLVRTLEVEFHSGPWRSGGLGDLKNLRALVSPANVSALVKHFIVTDGMRKSFKGDWGAQDLEGLDLLAGGDSGGDDNGLVQDLNRMSYLTYVSHVRRVNNPISRDLKMPEPHRILASQWGAVCPVESPDGPNIGLLKHMALLLQVSHTTSDPTPLCARLMEEGLMTDLRALEVASLSAAPGPALKALRAACRVLVNDTWIGITADPAALASRIREMRRLEEHGATLHTSVAWSIQGNELSIHTDEGRCCRPLVRVMYGEDGTGRPMSLKLMQPAAKGAWRDLLTKADAPIDMIDVEELRTRLVAMRPSEIAKRRNDGFTHCELTPQAILSAVTATYPLLHHNHGPYNVLCLAQFKQALGMYATSYRSRMDTLGCVMHYPQRALLSTRTEERLCSGNHAHGQNLVVAIACYNGYNQEDAVILNKDAVERGLFHTSLFKTMRYDEDDASPLNDNVPIIFANPMEMMGKGLDVQGARVDSGYAHLGPDGLPTRDAHISESDVIIGKVQAVPTHDASEGLVKSSQTGERAAWVDRSEQAGRSMSGVVDRVIVYPQPPQPGATRGSSARSCKVRIRQVRAPELGDKVASRFGQKGVVGMLVPAQDMPFSHTSGLVPDLIINPHGFPKRMTVTHILECILGKAGAASGTRYRADTFDQVDAVREAETTLDSMGLERRGSEVFYNGLTGEQMQSDVFVGVNYYGRLKHMAEDKYQFRSRGRLNALVRQPVKTAGASGGLRVGEMEQNVLLAHGLGSFVKESFMDRSDRFRTAIDARDGTVLRAPGDLTGVAKNRKLRSQGPLPPRAHPFGDARDDAAAHAVAVEVPYAFKLLQQELCAMSVDIRMDVLDASDLIGGGWDDAVSAASEDAEESDADGDDDGAVDFGDGHGEDYGADGDGGRWDGGDD